MAVQQLDGVSALGEASDAAIRGFAARKKLELRDSRARQLEVIRAALDSGAVLHEDLESFLKELPRIDEAMRSLGQSRYKLAARSFARNQSLEVREEPQSQLETIRAAMFLGKVTPEEIPGYLSEVDRIDEAVGWFKQFRSKEPPTLEFCRQYEIPRGRVLEDTWSNVRMALYEERVSRRQLVDYLDGLAENGRQHTFLYRLDPKTHGDYLSRLADPEYLKGRLRDAQIPDCVTKPRFVWKPDNPEMAQVSIRDNSRLMCKWVETRRWRQLQERKLIFFHLNLRTGEAEIRIEKIEHSLGAVLKSSLRDSWQRLGKVIEFDRFSPVLLEPAIRQLMRARQFQIDRFALELPHGGSVKGQGGGRDFLNTLKLAFRRFFAAEIAGDWVVDRKKHPIRVNGRSDELRLNWEWDARSSANFLQKIHRNGAVPLAVVSQRAEEDGAGKGANGDGQPAVEWLLIQEKGLKSIKEIGRRTIELRELQRTVPQALYSFEELLQALESGGSGCAELSGFYYWIQCPDDEKPVCDQNGVMKKYIAYKKIPRTIACYNNDRRKKHNTASLIRMTFPNLEVQPNPRILVPYLMLMGFFIVATFAFGYLLSQVETKLMRLMTATGYLLNLVVLTAFARQVIGPEELYEAMRELQRITEKVKGWLPKSPRSESRKVGFRTKAQG